MVAALEERIGELQSTMQRLIPEHDAERAWLEHDRAGRIEDAARQAEQLARQGREMFARLAEASAKAGGAG